MITKQKLIEIIRKSVGTFLQENKEVSIKKWNWNSLDYESGERVLECTPNSVIICSDDCTIRLSAIKRYNHPENMNQLNGFYQKYWKFLGWEVNAITYRNGAWEKFNDSFPRMLKSKKEVFEFIKRTKSFNLAKKELNIF